MTKSLLHGGERHKKSAIQYSVTRTIREVGPGTMAVQERMTQWQCNRERLPLCWESPGGQRTGTNIRLNIPEKKAQHCFHHPSPQSFLSSLFVSCLVEDFFS